MTGFVIWTVASVLITGIIILVLCLTKTASDADDREEELLRVKGDSDELRNNQDC
jgi:hypothetical protein